MDSLDGRIVNAVSWCSKYPGIECADHTLDLYRPVACASDAQEVLPCKGWEVTASQLDLPSLTPLTIAIRGRLQLGVAYKYLATSVALLQEVDN